MWNSFNAIPHLDTILSILGILLSIVGFGITIAAAVRARRAAVAAETAAKRAVEKMLRIDLVAEIATVLQQIEELKRLHRSNAVELIPDRYSTLRSKLVSLRESGFLRGDSDQTAIQDVISRLALLERSIDNDPKFLSVPKQLARSNDSLSVCTQSIIVFRERVRNATGAST